MGLAGRVWRRLRRLFDPLPSLEGEPARLLVPVGSAGPIGALADREKARVTGIIKSIAIGPRGPGAVFEVELADGTGQLRVIWLGQRQILGLEPGRQLVWEGMVAFEGGEAVMRDQHYELLAVGTAP